MGAQTLAISTSFFRRNSRQPPFPTTDRSPAFSSGHVDLGFRRIPEKNLRTLVEVCSAIQGRSGEGFCSLSSLTTSMVSAELLEENLRLTRCRRRGLAPADSRESVSVAISADHGFGCVPGHQCRRGVFRPPILPA